MKRLFDLILSFVFLFISAIPLLIIALLIRYFIGKPILFRQRRPGLHGQPFQMYKFRTMSNDRDQNGILLPDNKRLTKFGIFLRKSSLDELPELLNVFKGEMSLVGPRPLLMEYLPLYDENQQRRHLVRPGITGWAQINGRNAISWAEKFNLDIWYVENQSLLLDIKILILTILKVFKREGINSSANETMPLFQGSKNTID